jgi:hypothetical protein
MLERNVSQAASSFVVGSLAISNTAAHALPVSLPPGTKCRRVFLYAPVNNSGVGSNTAPVFFGDATTQSDWIATDGTRDRMLHVDDPARIYMKGNGQTINYRVEY